jgi:hypothetical protein
MLQEINHDIADTIAIAKNRIRTGDVPSWVNDCSLDLEFKTDHHDHLTYLLFDRQIHAERREVFEHTAIRLETLEAVQHQSQWRWQFEPRTQSVILHFLKIRRDGTEINHLNFEKGHLLQREEGLDRLMIHGWFTFLLVLDDVRPGDILEWAVTTETNHQLLPKYHVSFFNLPEWASVGRYHYSLLFDPARSMQWKSSGSELKPTEQQADGLTVWVWTADKYVGLKREPNTPAWYVSAPWIQVSDCPDWQTVATAISETWSRQEDGAGLDEIVSGIEKQEPDLIPRIGKAIQLIQDEYRYLSVNLEFGGQIPTPPQIVARRRYGDCKDLSFLLVNLLKRLGVQARPILVHAGLRKFVGNVLPTPGVFNHVIVEFEVEGNRRWVDATMKRQGGGALNRVVVDFGLGLPVDPMATGLVESPKIPKLSNLYELRETILLDTSGGASLIAMVVRAEGEQAERLRHQFETMGVEEVAKQELQYCANRFAKATRVGLLKYRDDRIANHFFTAQVFEINGFLGLMANRKQCQFKIPSSWITNTLQKPEEKERRTPFNLPYPFQITHIVDVESPTITNAFRQTIGPRCSLQSEFVQFNRVKKTSNGYWMTTFSLNVIADSVPVNQLGKHREFVENVWKESLFHLFLPVGYSRPRQPRGFGELPAPVLNPFPTHKPDSAISQKLAELKTEPELREPIITKSLTRPLPQSLPTKISSSAQSHRHRQKTYEKSKIPLWLIFVAIGTGIFIVFVFIAVAARHKP